MPYIDKETRQRIDNGQKQPYTPGELNYAITKLVNDYLDRRTCDDGGIYCEPDAHYADFNEALGALDAAKLELYRRRIAPYEDGKVKENGDIGAYEQRNPNDQTPRG